MAVVDVGSNTIRLHVAEGGTAIYRERAVLRLGESVERFGSIPEVKLAETVECVSGFVREAARHGAERTEVMVTSPGRQAANGDELIARLAQGTGVPVRLLDAVDEGRLAFVGAAAAARGNAGRLVAVCDVGGGSTQIVVGTRREGPAWLRSIDIGSMRLTTRLLEDDPPGDAAVQAARAEVDRLLAGIVPPLPETALAVGGSARALRSIVGPTLGAEELDELAEILARTPASELVQVYGIGPERAPTLAAGAVILGALRQRLHIPLRVVRGGVREGAVLELERRRVAA